MVPFCGWDSTDSRLQPLRGGSLLFTIQFIFLKFFLKKKKEMPYKGDYTNFDEKLSAFNICIYSII